jgi:hemerythrin superfamily protein
MDAISLTLQDHRHVESLFARYESLTGDGDAKRDIVREIIRELSIHAAIEEQFLYPTMRNNLPDGPSLVEEAIQEHQEAKETLDELEGMSPQEGGYDSRVRSLIQDVRHHVQEEEGELLPKLRAAVSQERLDQLGQAMESGKGLAPTRPHPGAPSTPPGNILASPAAAVVDRVRDRMRGEGPEETPSPKRPARKRTTRKPAARKSTARKPAARKPAARKGVTTRKTTRRKTTARKKTAARKRTTARGPVYHVTTDPKGGWRATRSGSSRPLARGDSKQEVVRRARDSARRQKGRLVIHKANGRIQEERTYGPDPRRHRG